jgi:predicted nuclease with TOPRIM domain
MTRKVVLEYQELQVKYATLEEEHTKLKKKNEKLSANYKALRERYDHVISRRGGDKHNDMMNVSTEENQTSEHRGT